MKKTLFLLTLFLKLSAYEPEHNPDAFADQQLQELDVRQIPLDELTEGPFDGLPPDTFTYVKKGMRPLASASLGGGILLQGDIRTKFEWGETKDGSTSLLDVLGVGHDRITQEFNFYLKYFARRSTAIIQVRFKNDMGILGGTTSKRSIEKAYFNYDLYANGPHQINFTIGRRPLLEMLESQVQFISRMDGVSLDFLTTIDKWSDFELRLIGTIVDPVSDQFAYFIQLGIHNIFNTKLYFLYSFASWKINKTSRIFDGDGKPSEFPVGTSQMRHNPRFDFNISQLVLGYILDSIPIPLWFYGAVLYNHTAERRMITRNRRYDFGYYVGVTISNAVEKGTFSIDINYQYLPPQVIPGFDVSGIDNGNVRDNAFYGPASNDITGVAITPATLTASNANGSVNYQGISIAGAYVLTDHLTLQAAYSYSVRAIKSIGPDRTAYGFEIRTIYAF